MEHPNARLMREVYEAFGTGDLAVVRERIAPSVTFHIPPGNVLSGDYEGADAVFAMFAKVFQLTGGTFHLEIHDVTGSDDHVAGLTHGAGERDGKPFRYRNVHVAHFAGGKLRELWEFPDADIYNAAWHA